MILDDTGLLGAFHSLQRNISSCIFSTYFLKVYTYNIISWSNFTYIFEKRMHLLRCLCRRENCSQNSPHWRIQGVINSAPNTLISFHLCDDTRIISKRCNNTLAKSFLMNNSFLYILNLHQDIKFQKNRENKIQTFKYIK